MKFAVHLNAHITPEWRTQYVAYDDLKEMLYFALEKQPNLDSASDEEMRFYYSFEQKFFKQCEQELSKVEMFFSEKLAEAQRKAVSLQSEVTRDWQT